MTDLHPGRLVRWLSFGQEERKRRRGVHDFLGRFGSVLVPYSYVMENSRSTIRAICQFMEESYISVAWEIEREANHISWLLPFVEPYYVFLYEAVRCLKSKLILETGVCKGYSSSVILKALDNLGGGRLYSVDLPPREYVRDDGTVVKDECDERLVPEELRTRWKLSVGESTKVMPKILDSIEKLDLFIHDGEHTYEVMMFEFSSVWDKLTEGGVLVSDDIDWSRAFNDFAAKIGRAPFILDRTRNGQGSFGVIVK